jgi:hypothetical protein
MGGFPMLIQALPVGNINNNRLSFTRNAQQTFSYSIGGLSVPIQGAIKEGECARVSLPPGRYPVSVGLANYSYALGTVASADAVITYLVVYPVFGSPAGNGPYIFVRSVLDS